MKDARAIVRDAVREADWDGPTVHDVLLDYIDSLGDLDRFRAFLQQEAAKERAAS